jgi:hypothetical protein
MRHPPFKFFISHKYIHFIISMVRIMNNAGILLAVEKGLDSVLLSPLTTFADDLIEFPEENAGLVNKKIHGRC